MGDTGLEHTALTGKKQAISRKCGTESGTVDSAEPLQDEDLREIIRAWATLPENIKKAMRALVG